MHAWFLIFNCCSSLKLCFIFLYRFKANRDQFIRITKDLSVKADSIEDSNQTACFWANNILLRKYVNCWLLKIRADDNCNKINGFMAVFKPIITPWTPLWTLVMTLTNQFVCWVRYLVLYKSLEANVSFESILLHWFIWCSWLYNI